MTSALGASAREALARLLEADGANGEGYFVIVHLNAVRPLVMKGQFREEVSGAALLELEGAGVLLSNSRDADGLKTFYLSSDSRALLDSAVAAAGEPTPLSVALSRTEVLDRRLTHARATLRRAAGWLATLFAAALLAALALAYVAIAVIADLPNAPAVVFGLLIGVGVVSDVLGIDGVRISQRVRRAVETWTYNRLVAWLDVAADHETGIEA